MRILAMIMANVMVVIVSVMGVHEYFSLKKHGSFIVPFTDKMVKLGVIERGKRDRIIKEERIIHCVGIGLSLLVWGMLAWFLAGISAVPVFIVASAVQLIALKPDMSECTVSRSQYFNAHKNDMDIVKYHEYLKTVEDAPQSAA